VPVILSQDPPISLNTLQELGRSEESKNPTRFETRLREVKPSDLMTICYTSGTTGVPKGVMISHDNLISVIEDCISLLAPVIDPEEETTVTFLPYSHILGRVESMCVYPFGWTVYFAENIDRLMLNLKEVQPSVMFAVPRIFEKAHTRIREGVNEGSIVKRTMFSSAIAVAKKYFENKNEGRSNDIVTQLEYQLANRVVFSKVRAALGGKLKFAICGGAPLPKEIGQFFQWVGIEVLEGYGLTETCAPVAINTPENPVYGTVGRPLPEVLIRIAEDGEVLVKSRKVFLGYYKMDKETADVLHDGWFHTGDIGHLDESGYLHITDRKKDLIVTSAGKNIAPQKIENLAKSLPYVNQFVVHGDKRNYLTALITLDKEKTIKYASENHILFSRYEELVKNSRIHSLIQGIIDELNGNLAQYETIKKFTILPNEFTVESGEITPSLKVKRNIITKRYHDQLDSMYT
jgi:long-chain acyl-CoA synthetase